MRPIFGAGSWAATWSTCSHALRKWNKDEIRFPNRGHVSTSIACSSISWIPQSWWKKITPCNSPQFWKFQEQPSSRAARYPPPWVLENKWLPSKMNPKPSTFPELCVGVSSTTIPAASSPLVSWWQYAVVLNPYLQKAYPQRQKLGKILQDFWYYDG